MHCLEVTSSSWYGPLDNFTILSWSQVVNQSLLESDFKAAMQVKSLVPAVKDRKS